MPALLLILDYTKDKHTGMSSIQKNTIFQIFELEPKMIWPMITNPKKFFTEVP